MCCDKYCVEIMLIRLLYLLIAFRKYVFGIDYLVAGQKTPIIDIP